MSNVVLIFFTLFGFIMGGLSIVLALKSEKGLDKAVGWFLGAVCSGGALVCLLIILKS